jgi:hypothetical protein
VLNYKMIQVFLTLQEDIVDCFFSYIFLWKVLRRSCTSSNEGICVPLKLWSFYVDLEGRLSTLDDTLFNIFTAL